MNNEPNPNRKYKRYDPAFKRSALELWGGAGASPPKRWPPNWASAPACSKTWKQQLALPPPANCAQTLEQLQG
jgi:hypothetical protein